MASSIVRTPVYQQLNQVLRDLATTNEFAPGQRFLTEREVATRFAVSRATANKAISNLVSEGLLEFRKGVGTFLRGNRLDADLRELVSFTAKAQAAGKSPETRVVDFRLASAQASGEDIAGVLGLAPDAPVVAMVRLRLADGQPLILERRWLPAALVPGLAREDVGGSIYSLLNERFALSIGGCEQSLSAVNLDREEASALATAVGAAGLQVRSTGFLGDGRPLWHERTLYRGDGYTFVNRLGRIPGGVETGLSSLISATR